MSKLEVRTAAIGGVEGRTLTGYAALYNTWSKPLPGIKGEFREQIAPGAFDGQKNNVSLFYMHDSRQVLANSKSGTLVLESDDKGLRYTATLGENSRDEAVLDQVRRGVLNEMSFGFRVPEGGDSWSGRDRTLKRVELREVSVVEVGAYSGTTAEARQETQPTPRKAATVMVSNLTLREVRTKLTELEQRKSDTNLTEDARADIGCEIEELREVRKTLLERDAGVQVAATPARRTEERREAAAEWRSSREYESSWRGWLRGGPAPEQREIISTASSSILIPKQTEEQILKYISAESIAQRVCDFRTVRQGDATLRWNTLESTQYTNAWSPPDTGSTAAVDIDPGFAEASLKPLPILPKTQVSEQLIKSANFDVEAEVMDNLMRQFAKMSEAGFMAGVTNGPSNALFTVQTGTNITTATSTGTSRALAVTAAATVANLMDMRYTQLPAAYWGSASWILPKDVYAKIADIRAATSGSNVPIFVPSSDAGLTQGASGFLLGLPVYVTDFLPTHVATASTGKNCLALLGNFRDSFAIRSWEGMTMRRDDLTAANSARIVFRGFGWANAAFTRAKAMVQLQVTNA
jgi:HK97 family phage major capsid protein/HK97 family phage prohead protease